MRNTFWVFLKQDHTYYTSHSVECLVSPLHAVLTPRRVERVSYFQVSCDLLLYMHSLRELLSKQNMQVLCFPQSNSRVRVAQMLQLLQGLFKCSHFQLSTIMYTKLLSKSTEPYFPLYFFHVNDPFKTFASVHYILQYSSISQYFPSTTVTT